MAEIVYPIIGWIYLWIRYRNKEKVKQVLKEEFENSYENAGATLSLKTFGVIMIILLVCFLLGMIYAFFKHSL